MFYSNCCKGCCFGVHTNIFLGDFWYFLWWTNDSAGRRKVPEVSWSVVFHCCGFGKPFQILHINCCSVFQRFVVNFLECTCLCYSGWLLLLTTYYLHVMVTVSSLWCMSNKVVVSPIPIICNDPVLVNICLVHAFSVLIRTWS